MGMSTYVVVIKPPDDKWKAMKAIYDACAEAGVEPPEEVDSFFNGEEPDDAGVHESYSDYGRNLPPFIRKYDDGMREGYEVLVNELPPDIKIIRFVNSW